MQQFYQDLTVLTVLRYHVLLLRDWQVLEFAHRAPGRVSVPELLQQLEVTENELENIKVSG